MSNQIQRPKCELQSRLLPLLLSLLLHKEGQEEPPRSILHPSISSPFAAEEASEESSRPGDGGDVGVRSGPGGRHRRFRQALLPPHPAPNPVSAPSPFSLLETKPRPAHEGMGGFRCAAAPEHVYAEYSSEMWKRALFLFEPV
jgi:hypothetical protein